MRKSLLLVAAMAACISGTALADDAPATTISGLMYVDMTDINTQANGKDVDPSGYGLDVKRFYVGITHSFDQTWSTNFTTDFNYSPTTGETQLFAKKAYLQQYLGNEVTLRYGEADLPWVLYVENLYGYRFVERTLVDREGFGTTVDWGVHVLGHTDSVNYAASVVNGGGFKNPSRSKRMDEEGRVGFTPIDGLTIALGYRTGTLDLDTDTTPAVNTASRTDVLAVWKASGLTLGGEYFSAKNYTVAAITTPVTDKADGYSLFSSYDFADTAYSMFVRYDDTKPSKDVAPSMVDKYFNVGFAWKGDNNITWALAYKGDKLDNGANETKTDELGIWAQVKF